MRNFIGEYLTNELDMIPDMRHKKFHEFWGYDADAFLDDAKENGIPLLISDDTTRTAYFLLLAEFANSTIGNDDENQFKNRLFATIFRYGPTWEKRLDVQAKIRALTEEEISRGAKQIINKAEHPGTQPSTASLEELQMISEQTAVSSKRDKLTGYNNLLALLETDVTASFIDRFRPLFMKCVAPERPTLYRNTVEDEDDD